MFKSHLPITSVLPSPAVRHVSPTLHQAPAPSSSTSSPQRRLWGTAMATLAVFWNWSSCLTEGTSHIGSSFSDHHFLLGGNSIKLGDHGVERSEAAACLGRSRTHPILLEAGCCTLRVCRLCHAMSITRNVNKMDGLASARIRAKCLHVVAQEEETPFKSQ